MPGTYQFAFRLTLPKEWEQLDSALGASSFASTGGGVGGGVARYHRFVARSPGFFVQGPVLAHVPSRHSAADGSTLLCCDPLAR